MPAYSQARALTDDRVVSCPLREITRYPVASPTLLKVYNFSAKPEDLGALPWIGLSSTQFGGPREVALHSGASTHAMEVDPIFITEGGVSIREAVRMALGIAILPEWLVEVPSRVKAFINFATEYLGTVLQARYSSGS